MDHFTIKSALGDATLEFFAREPVDAARPTDYFSIRVTGKKLDASARVYAFSPHSRSLPRLFEEAAAEWQGWDGVKSWESLEREFEIRCSNDRRGHVTAGIELRSGLYHLDWYVQFAVLVEAGQLDELARRAREFFGVCP